MNVFEILKAIKGRKKWTIGVYKITNPEGKIYIGQSYKMYCRFYNYSRYGCKLQTKLRISFEKYGVINHTFEILEECDIEQLNEIELKYQIEYDSVNNGLNSVYVKLKKQLT